VFELGELKLHSWVLLQEEPVVFLHKLGHMKSGSVSLISLQFW
jgi:hypothetical protein